MRNEIQAVEKKMVAALEALKTSSARCDRTRVRGAARGVMVSSYGVETPLKQVCNLTVPESSLIVAHRGTLPCAARSTRRSEKRTSA